MVRSAKRGGEDNTSSLCQWILETIQAGVQDRRIDGKHITAIFDLFKEMVPMVGVARFGATEESKTILKEMGTNDYDSGDFKGTECEFLTCPPQIFLGRPRRSSHG